MQLTFTPKQLSAEVLAGVLNQAFIASTISEDSRGKQFVSISLNGIQCNLKTLGNTLQFSSAIRIDNSESEESVKKVVEHINYEIIHAKHTKVDGEDSHLITHHYAHWIPEDETISAAYIVKLTRSFTAFLEKHLNRWNSLAQEALR